MSIQKLFYPQTVAVIGSVSQGKLGYELIQQMLAGGYSNIFAVNPKAQAIGDVRGFVKVTDIPDPVDLAILASPAATVPEMLQQCGEKGISAAVIISSGFSEVGNHQGEEDIKAIAQKYNIRVVGPNCAGILNTSNNLFATLEMRPPKGQMAFISQSGALGGAVLAWAEEQNIGISKFVSYGNHADLDEIDLLPYLAEDEETRVVGLYVESIKNGRKFIQVAQEFVAKKPLVVIKSGRTASGQRAALSHTGSMAGSDQVYDAALKKAGVIRVESLEDLFDLCRGFISLPPVSGNKTAIVTNSGGPGILTADKAELSGLKVISFSPQQKERLAASLPSYAAVGNPVDLTVQGTEEDFERSLEIVLEECDSAIAINVATPYLDNIALARGIADAAFNTKKPVAASFMAGRLVSEAIQYLKTRGIPNYATGERAAKVFSLMAQYESSHLKITPFPVLNEQPHPLPKELLEPVIMQWLSENNVAVPKFKFVTQSQSLSSDCEEIGYPLVMKVVSPQILHKSEFGGVKLNIQSLAEAEKCFEELCSIAKDKDFRGVVIYPMLQKQQEVLVGLSSDPQFGPVILLGAGGIFTEYLKDVIIHLAPLTLCEAQDMIKQLKIYPILSGARGQKPCDLASLANLLVQVSMLPFSFPEIDELDLNPVFLSPSNAVIGDARVISKSKQK
jgi:acetyltransferase